ncbi:HD domain-containing protein [Alcaligenes endophyticus]|uniref:ATP-binding protein n=1 Tax=Alcaligenes endophyticus TaxID=1929088 RepID=A0ABT8EK92_9BURK|nr:ATP-binding protein [Alcaligenes endophyticus]MCX5592008.1 ATP-binding protein [Alcaligenes endophyticus]MDN4121698.1 ATP-binding protein [Alcaligenes endophyticus]
MADLLTEHLKKKSEGDSSLQLLFSQWDFDRKLIPKALQTIGNLFPHYSRHDESHSRQILVNIERLLGNNLALLTATDIWLLLEAAYWHDIGMVVPQRDLEEALSDPDFDGFLQTFVSQPHHELHAIALALNEKSGSFQIFFNETPLVSVTRFRELMAEWFRLKHPARAEHIINTPYSSVGLSSPRTELIPARLFSILGRICSMHGASFETLIGADGLSFREVGMGRDDCHPRFVACLLRLGDLLDLDDNRFCPVMQGIAGEDRPALSMAHEDKHAAIRHLRIDQERISIEAECQTVDGYMEAFRWFGWLKEEMRAQMSRWRDIVPNRELGLLPMLEPVSVRLAGSLKILKNGERPAFTLDTKKAIEMLQGGNLYESEYACIRELLQNSVDATLLKIWMTHRATIEDNLWKSPDEKAIQELLRNATIQVSLTQSETYVTDADEMSCWTLTIQDAGTGISLDDLQYMLQIGGSHRNTARKREIDTMPEWMKPSGVFGIGFQSIFMLCDQVSLKTKSLLTNDILEVTMYSPTSPHEGLTVIQLLEPNISEPTGTTIKLRFEREKYPTKWAVPIQDDGSILYRIFSSLDPVFDGCFPFAVAKLADHIRKFDENSMIRIEGELQTLSGSYPFNREKIETCLNQGKKPWRFVRTQSAEVRIRYWPQPLNYLPNEIKAFYRGQAFEVKNIFLPYVTVDIDLLSGSAGSWLNFNRDSISAASSEKLLHTILESLKTVVDEDLSTLNEPETPCALPEDRRKQISLFSLFLKRMELGYAGAWIDLSKRLDSEWLDYPYGKSGESLKPVFELKDWVLVEYGQLMQQKSNFPHTFAVHANHNMLPIIASEWLKKPGRYLQVLGDDEVLNKSGDTVATHEVPNQIIQETIKHDYYSYRFRFTSEKVEPYDNAAFAAALAQKMSSTVSNQRVKSYLCDRFAGLALAPNTALNVPNLFPLCAASETDVLLPFLFRRKRGSIDGSIEATSEQLKRLCEWVKPRLKQPSDLDSIHRLYSDLINWIDNDVMSKTIFSERWLLARGLQGSVLTE